jgi:CDP-glycerol glycerophosphotransferase
MATQLVPPTAGPRAVPACTELLLSEGLGVVLARHRPRVSHSEQFTAFVSLTAVPPHALSRIAPQNGRLSEVDDDYVWCAEANDRFSAHTEAIAARLEEVRPDVLFLAAGSRTPGGSFTVEEWPPALDLAPGLGGKVFRAAFLRELSVDVSAGDFGELPLTYTALLAAERIAVWERGGVGTEPAMQVEAAAAFDAYDRVFEAAEALGPEFEQRRRLLPVSMLLHYLALIGEVPAEERTDFFTRMSRSYARRSRGDEKVSAERRRAFHVRRRVSTAERRGGRPSRASALLRSARRAGLNAYYAVQLRRPVDPDLAVFAAYWYTAFACNPRAIYEALRRLCPHVRTVWVVNRAHESAMPPDVAHVVAGTREYVRLVARAKWFVNNVGFPEQIVKREEAVRVHTHHGTPVKTMGLHLRDALIAGEKTDFERQRRRWARWDYSITQNRFTTLEWARAYPGSYETLEVGYPRNDVLARATEDDVRRAREKLGIQSNRFTVLYAPTHREYVRGFLCPLDIERLAERLGAEYLVLSRMHYLEPHSRSGGPRADRSVRDVSGHPSIEELFLAADALVTDYSSVVFDYAVLDRPIVIHAPDWEIYRTLRGTYFDLLLEPPGVVAREEDEIADAFTSGRAAAGEAAALRAAFRERFCTLEDGRAAERVVRAVWRAGVEDNEQPAPASVGRARIGA